MAQDGNLFLLHLLEAVVFVWMLVSIETTEADTTWLPEDLFDPQMTIVVDRIQVAIGNFSNRGPSRIHSHRGAVSKDWQHAVTANSDAFSSIKLDAVCAQILLVETQARAIINFDTKAARARRKLYLAKERDLHLGGVQRGFSSHA